MSDDEVLVHREGYVGVVEFNRPKRQNAFTWKMYDLVSDAMDRHEDDDEVRVIVFRGAGPSFSSGFDLGEPLGADHVARQKQMVRIAHKTRLKVWNQPKPTIAQIHGYCLGGAHDLALACDCAIAAEDAKLGVPEIQFGMGSPFLLMPWIVGLRKTKELLLTGKTISGAQAAAYGIVNYAVPLAGLADRVQELAEEFAQVPPPALILQKKGINRAVEMSGFSNAANAWLDLAALGRLWKSPEVEEFNAVASRDGFKAALKWRKQKYARKPARSRK